MTINLDSCAGTATPKFSDPQNWFPDEPCGIIPLLPDDGPANDCGIDIGAPTVPIDSKRYLYGPPSQQSLVQTTFGPRLMDLYSYGYDIGLCDYPIYDEAFRPVLNRLISDHFYMREIGAETIQMFVFFLNRTMRENMPLLNPVFKRLADPNYDPFAEDMNTTYCGTNQGQANGTSNENSASDAVASNAPQSNLAAGGVPEGEAGTTPVRARYGYWNTGQFGDNEVHSATEQDTESLTQYVQNRHGSNMLGFQMMQYYLQGYMNPLNMLFEILEPCFSQLWSDHFNGV